MTGRKVRQLTAWDAWMAYKKRKSREWLPQWWASRVGGVPIVGDVFEGGYMSTVTFVDLASNRIHFTDQVENEEYYRRQPLSVFIANILTLEDVRQRRRATARGTEWGKRPVPSKILTYSAWRKRYDAQKLSK